MIARQLNSGLPPPFLVVIIAAAVVLFSFLFHKIKAPTAANKRPPGPFGLPLLGNLHQIGKLPHHYMKAMSDKYGPLMQLKLGQVPVVVVSSASLAQEMLKAQDLAFSNRPPYLMADKLLYGSSDMVFGPYGEQWRQMRRICVLQLLGIKQVQSFRPVLDDEVRVMLRKIQGAGDNVISDTTAAPASVVVNLTEIISTLNSNIFCRAAFGKAYSGKEGGDRIRGMLDELMSLLGSFPVGDFIPWLSWVDTLTGLNGRANRNFKQLDTFLNKVIDDHRSSSSSANTNHVPQHHAASDPPAPQDFVDVLLSLEAAADAGTSPSESQQITRFSRVV